MPFHFCPQCGTKLQADFRFCPSCGEKLPGPAGPCPVTGLVRPTGDDSGSPKKAVRHNTNIAASNMSCASRESSVSFPPASVSPRPPLGKARRSIFGRQAKGSSEEEAGLQRAVPLLLGGGRAQDNVVEPAVSPLKARSTTAFKRKDETEGPESPLVKKPPTPGRARPRRGKQLEEEEAQQTTRRAEEDLQDHVTSPSPGSPFSKASPGVRGKSRKARRVSAVTPLEEGEELTDTAGRKWRPGELLSQTATDLIYEVFASNSKDSKHILKLGAKDGRIFNEQNFLQRAAKVSSVDKWIKSTKLDFLGIPSCVGFGLHADYRFLIFPSMGQSLLSILENGGTLLSEGVVLHLSCRILDVLKFIHSNEYVHGDVSAENVYIKTEGHSQGHVFLAGYSHAFRYCPGGQHVEYREASRTPHEGALEYISVDSHKGAGPSQRSDLQSLGYCMLHWHTGSLPWVALTDPQHIARDKQRFMEDVPALLRSCFGNKRASSAMQQYLTRVMALGYAETPDYTTLKAGLHDALVQLGGALEQPLVF